MTRVVTGLTFHGMASGLEQRRGCGPRAYSGCGCRPPLSARHGRPSLDTLTMAMLMASIASTERGPPWCSSFTAAPRSMVMTLCIIEDAAGSPTGVGEDRNPRNWDGSSPLLVRCVVVERRRASSPSPSPSPRRRCWRWPWALAATNRTDEGSSTTAWWWHPVPW